MKSTIKSQMYLPSTCSPSPEDPPSNHPKISMEVGHEPDTVQARQEWLEQAAQRLSKQASTLSWHQTTAHLGLLGDSNRQPNNKHIEHCVACQKSNEQFEI